MFQKWDSYLTPLELRLGFNKGKYKAKEQNTHDLERICYGTGQVRILCWRIKSWEKKPKEFSKTKPINGNLTQE